MVANAGKQGGRHFIWHFDWRNERILVSDTPDSLPSTASAIRLLFTTDGYHRALVSCTFPNGASRKFIVDTGGNGFFADDRKLFDALKAKVSFRVYYGLASYGSLRELVHDTSYMARIPRFKVAHLTVDTAEVLFGRGHENHG